MNAIKQLAIFAAVGILLAGCSAQNPTSPSISDESETTFTTSQIKPGEAFIPVKLTPTPQTYSSVVTYTGLTYRATVYYGQNDPLTGFPKITAIQIQNYYGPATARYVQAQTLSGYIYSPPASPVTLSAAYNAQMGTLYLGIDTDGHLVYAKQSPSFAMGQTLFCHYIRSMTATSLKITTY